MTAIDGERKVRRVSKAVAASQPKRAPLGQLCYRYVDNLAASVPTAAWSPRSSCMMARGVRFVPESEVTKVYGDIIDQRSV